MRISALIMGICPPQRLEWLKTTLDYMDLQDFPFHRKVLAIDEYDGHKFPPWLKDNLEARDWTVVIDNHRNRIKSMEHALQYTDSDIVFYNEDDVKATLPDYDLVKSIFTMKDNNRTCSMLSMTCGGTDMDIPRQYFGDLRDMEDRAVFEDDDKIVFIRDEAKGNVWFFEFPGLFVRSSVLISCLSSATARYKGQQIEQGLTSAYFSDEMDELFFKCSLLKSDTLSILADDPYRLITHCRFLENLDPNQGASPLGGCHSF